VSNGGLLLKLVCLSLELSSFLSTRVSANSHNPTCNKVISPLRPRKESL
jgi:hypothetical protein